MTEQLTAAREQLGMLREQATTQVLYESAVLARWEDAIRFMDMLVQHMDTLAFGAGKANALLEDVESHLLKDQLHEEKAIPSAANNMPRKVLPGALPVVDEAMYAEVFGITHAPLEEFVPQRLHLQLARDDTIAWEEAFAL